MGVGMGLPAPLETRGTAQRSAATDREDGLPSDSEVTRSDSEATRRDAKRHRSDGGSETLCRLQQGGVTYNRGV